jgi:N-acetylneuraminic acid mutarotase
MNRTYTLLFVLVNLTASCVFAQPVLSSDESSERPWASMTPMPVKAYGFKAGVVDDAVYLFRLNYTFEYNHDSWSTKKSMPTPRSDLATATYKNKIYCIGGKTDFTPSPTNQVYDPASGSWESKNAMPTPRHGLDANLVNGKIYLISGLVQHSRFADVEGTFERTNITEVYDPDADTWTTKAPIPNPASYYASAVINNRIYIISEKFTQIYDTGTDTWSFGASPPFPVDMAAGATVTGLTPQRIYVIGGRNPTLEVAYNQVYNTENDSWTLGTPIPTARYGLTVAVVNNKIYSFGGLTGSFVAVVQKNSNEQYDPLKDKTTPDSSPTSPSPSPTASPSLLPSSFFNQEPSQIVLVATVSVAAVALVVAGLRVYFRRRKGS